MTSSKERFKLITAAYLILRDGNKVLLHKRANSGYQDGMYGLVAGHLEGDELATVALVREAYEEAGITVDPKDLQFSHVAHRLSRNEVGQERIDLFFSAPKWSGQVTNVEPHKCGGLDWYPIDALPDTVIPFVRNVLLDVANGITYSEYLVEPEA